MDPGSYKMDSGEPLNKLQGFFKKKIQTKTRRLQVVSMESTGGIGESLTLRWNSKYLQMDSKKPLSKLQRVLRETLNGNH